MSCHIKHDIFHNWIFIAIINDKNAQMVLLTRTYSNCFYSSLSDCFGFISRLSVAYIHKKAVLSQRWPRDARYI